MTGEGGGAKYVDCPRCEGTGIRGPAPGRVRGVRCITCSGTGKASMTEPMNMKAPPWREMHPKKPRKPDDNQPKLRPG